MSTTTIVSTIVSTIRTPPSYEPQQQQARPAVHETTLAQSPRQEATPRPAVLALIACMSLHFFIFTWVSLNSTGLAQHYHRHRPQSNDVTRPRSKSRTDILTQPNALPRDCCCLGERRHQQQTRLPPSTYMNLQGASHMVCTRICGQQQDRRSGKESSHDHLRRQQAFCRCLCLCLSVEVFVHRRD